MEGFSNYEIDPPNRNKPHICRRRGWWRVSGMYSAPKRAPALPWHLAHRFINDLNNRRPEMATEQIEWFKFSDFKPDHNKRCYVHAINNWFITAMYEPDDGQFWDKDGQPVVGVIEWSYRPDRPE